MILQALDNYYQRLEDDPSVDIAPFGFSRQKIAFCVTLNTDGSLHSIDDVRDQDGSKRLPKSMIVCGNSKPSGSGINPGFLWDNPAYMLGYKSDDRKPARTQESFEAYRQRHLDAEKLISDAEFSAVCRFLEDWDPTHSERHKTLTEIATGFGVFRLRATDHFVHERKAVNFWWKSQLTNTNECDDELTSGQCLVSGQIGPLARLHEPKIQGVWGAQSAGALIVSFNDSAYTSYGKADGSNAPVGVPAAFQYCTALNHLLRAGSKQRIQIGDATTVFWTSRPTEAENLLPWIFEPTKDSEDEGQRTKVGAVLSRISEGGYPSELGEPDTPFYVLGLSPNAARISVRFWWESTLRDLIARLRQHFADLQLVRGNHDPEFPAAWQLIRETAREAKDIPSLLGGSVMRSILIGSPYPSILLTSLLRRIRADREVRYLRVAAIKATLNRNRRFGIDPIEKELAMSLDPDRKEQAYHMGRLFAELEKAQEDALPGINDTIKDRYFSSACGDSRECLSTLNSLESASFGKTRKRNASAS